MAPPLPPPGVPDRDGFAPCPMARLPTNRLSVTFHDTPMLLSAPPLLHTLAVKRLSRTSTGRPWYSESTRTAPPPMSGPLRSQRFPTNVELTMRRPLPPAAFPNDRDAQDPHPPAAREDRAAAAAIEVVADRVAVREAEVL